MATVFCHGEALPHLGCSKYKRDSTPLCPTSLLHLLPVPTTLWWITTEPTTACAQPALCPAVGIIYTYEYIG
jgi:hypothetical protein